jgi:hypothetical protein
MKYVGPIFGFITLCFKYINIININILIYIAPIYTNTRHLAEGLSESVVTILRRHFRFFSQLRCSSFQFVFICGISITVTFQFIYFAGAKQRFYLYKTAVLVTESFR